MKFINSYMIFLIFISFASIGQEDIMNKASDLYDKGDFDESIMLYDSLLNTGYYSAPLYYNLGSSYFKIGNFGQAMLYFEKALKYEPRNKDIQHNIYLTKRKIDSEIVELPDFFLKRWWYNFTNFFNLSFWTFLSVFFLLIFILSIGTTWFNKNGVLGDYSNYLVLFSVVIFIISALSANTIKNQIYNNKNAILIKENNIYSGPDIRSEVLYNLEPGEKILLEDSLKNWYKVQLMNKEIGWINKKDLVKI